MSVELAFLSFFSPLPSKYRFIESLAKMHGLSRVIPNTSYEYLCYDGDS